ncbi:MAG: methyltransferase domain-containing protein [Sulfurihydrogenibium sp.]
MSYYSSNRPEVQELVSPSSKRILDIGCGEGNLSFELKQKLNAECWGVEIYKPAFEKAVKKLDKVINLPIEESLNLLPDGYFDTIICVDVLEQLSNPWEVLKELKNKLKEDGEIIISIPNIANWSVLYELLKGEFKYTEAGILDKNHLRFFTRKSLISLLEENGLKIEILKANYSQTFKEFLEALKNLKDLNLAVDYFIQDANVEQFLLRAKKTLPKEIYIFDKKHEIFNYKVAVSTINYKNAEDTAEMVKSLLSQNYEKISIVIVDNSEDENQIEKLKNFFPSANVIDETLLNDTQLSFNKDIIILKSSFNRGFSAGNNLAINLALKNQTDFIWVLNNDTYIPENTVEALIYTLITTDSDVAICKIKDYYEKDLVQYNGNRVYIPPIVDYPDQLKEPIFLSGANVFSKANIYKEVGLWDEEYFYYFDDNDMHYRLKKAGKKIVYTPYTYIYHKLGASVKTRDSYSNPFTLYYIIRNHFLFLKKNFNDVSIAKKVTLTVYHNKIHDKELLYAIITAVYDFKKGKVGRRNNFDYKSIIKSFKPEDSLDELYISCMKNPRNDELFKRLLNYGDKDG